MSTENVFEKMLVEAERTDLQTLRADFLNEKDPAKQQVLHAPYTYVLDKRQEKVINHQEFSR
ncbi:MULTISPECIES: hypothetical protein [Furfurilactobacillus]|uniref:Uncharacterized protein n=1 Tax=Furfurilactobacillus rossiae TaxID=231049 RepID=A0A7C9ISR0_9LACO|nr:hypothetical protein [Furfurilactobacillus milii]MYV05476.1 hypothetical protein [Furfurilactobacillus milii]